VSRRFDEATRLEPCGNGRYELEVEEGDYWGVVTPHGGYLMALMFEAMQLEVAQAERRPRSLVQHFLGRIATGRVTIEVTIERTSRAVTSVTARMQSGENVAGLATAMFTTAREGPRFLDEGMPEVDPPSDQDEVLPIFIAPVHEHFDFHRRFGSDAAVVPVEDGGWVVPRESGTWDHRMALLLSDIWIPPIIRHPERVAATPSLHHAVHFGSDVEGKGGEAFLVRHQLTHGGEGISDEDISLWCDDGRLLLRARQLRMVVSPETMKIDGDWPGRD
jgi:acyl-coenzyme A thioesterase PaaI-like protein